MDSRGQPGQGKAKGASCRELSERGRCQDRGLNVFCTMPGSRACVLQTVVPERKDTIKRCEAACKSRCALINSPNKYFRGSRHRASKNAEQQALWRPPRTEWTGVGVGQRPSWLSGALAAKSLICSDHFQLQEVPAALLM